MRLKDISGLAKKRREWVNQEISQRLKGKRTSNTKRKKIFRQVWREAKRKFK